MTKKELKNIDTEWYHILKRITFNLINEKENKKTSYSLPEKNTKETHSRLIGTPKLDLNYKLSQSYFNKKYLDELTSLLKGISYKNFEEIKQIQLQLQELYSTDAYWKSLINKSQHELEALEELFKTPLKEFETLARPFINPSEEDLNKTQRSYRHYPAYKLRIFIQGFLRVLITSGGLPNLNPILAVLVENDYNEIIKHHINLRWIFYDLTRVVLRKTYDNLYNPRCKKHNTKTQEQLLTETSFVVNKNTIFYEYRKVFALYFLSCTFDYISIKYKDEFSNIEKNLTSILEVVRNFLWRKQHLYDLDDKKFSWWLKEFSQLTYSFLSIYEATSAIQIKATEIEPTEIDPNIEKQNPIKWVLPVPFEPAILQYTELPRIAPARKPINRDLEEALTPTLFGENKVSKNKKLKTILHIKQKKKFRVNLLFLRLVDELLYLDPNSIFATLLEESTIELPFPTERQVSHLKKNISNLENALDITPIDKGIFEAVHTWFVGKNINNLYIDQIKQAIGLTDFEISSQKSLTYLKRKLTKANQRLKYAHSSLTIAEIFKECSLYITNSFCVRVRLYPQQPLLSRTSGVYKQLLCDYNERKLTLDGYVSLIRCYYQSLKTDHIGKFEKFLTKTKLSKRSGKKTLYKFFYENPVPISESEVFFYTSLLYCEIIKAEKTGKTGVNVEIDQVASVLMFMACFFRNKKLAEITNLLGSHCACPYIFIMNYIKQNYTHSDGVEFSEKAYNLITSHRKTTKYVVMCFGYAQTQTGRYDLLLQYASEVYSGENDPIMENYLKDYANQFPKYFNMMFQNIVDQIEIIKKIVRITVKETDEMSINSFLGLNMSWKRYKTVKKKKRMFHPVTREQISVNILTTQLVNGQRVNNINDHVRQILSYIIHSIDASVIQYFILEIYKRENVVINTLHDCVLLHPNTVSTFYKIAADLYKSDILYNIAQTCFFEAVKKQVSADTLPEIIQLEAEFYTLCDDFKDELQNINIRDCYKGEN
jgi:hypothetical protein